LDTTGTTVSKIGDKGKGPKEFLGIFSYGFDEHNNVIAYDQDQDQDRISIYSLDQEIKGSFTGVRQDGFLVGDNSLYARDSLIYLPVLEYKYMTANQSYSSLVAVYNYQGNFIKTLGKYDPQVEKTPSYVKFTEFDIVNGRNIYSSHKSSHHIQVTNINNGNILDRFGTQSKHFEIGDEKISQRESHREIIRKFKENSVTAGIYTDGSYIYHHFFNSTDKWYQTRDYNDQINYLSIYDLKSQKYLDELKLPYPLASIANDGVIYLLKSSKPDSMIFSVYNIEVED